MSSRTNEAGSAYIAALLSLVVMSVMGLSVSLVAQTELLSGANERVTIQVMYAADAGLHEAIGRTLSTRNHDPHQLVFDEPDGHSGVADIEHQVEISRVLPILMAPCNLCQINQGGLYANISHAVTARARRTADGQVVAEAQVTSTVALAPTWPTIPAMNMESGELQPYN